MEKLESKFTYERPTKNTVTYREELGEVARKPRRCTAEVESDY